jgi:hypothetical protein
MVEVGSTYLVHLWAEKASSPLIPKHWEQLFQSVSSKQPTFNTLLQIQVSFDPLLLPNHARLRVGLWILVWRQLVSFKMVVSCWRNPNFPFCVQMNFCTICLAGRDSMNFDDAFLLFDMCWCYGLTWFGFLHILKFQVTHWCWTYAVVFKPNTLPRKLSWLGLFWLLADDAWCWYFISRAPLVDYGVLVVWWMIEHDRHEALLLF